MISIALTRIRHLVWNAAPIVSQQNFRFHAPIFPARPMNLEGRIRRFGNWPPEAPQYLDNPKAIHSWKDFIGDEAKAKKFLSELKKTTPVIDLIIRSEWNDATRSVSFDARKIQAAATIVLIRNQGLKECRINGIVLSKNGVTAQLAELISSLSYASFEVIRRD